MTKEKKSEQEPEEKVTEEEKVTITPVMVEEKEKTAAASDEDEREAVCKSNPIYKRVMALTGELGSLEPDGPKMLQAGMAGVEMMYQYVPDDNTLSDEEITTLAKMCAAVIMGTSISAMTNNPDESMTDLLTSFATGVCRAVTAAYVMGKGLPPIRALPEKLVKQREALLKISEAVATVQKYAPAAANGNNEKANELIHGLLAKALGICIATSCRNDNNEDDAASLKIIKQLHKEMAVPEGNHDTWSAPIMPMNDG